MTTTADAVFYMSLDERIEDMSPYAGNEQIRYQRSRLDERMLRTTLSQQGMSYERLVVELLKLRIMGHIAYDAMHAVESRIWPLTRVHL